MSTVSAIIPTYNRGGLLEEAIGSILAQSRPPDQIIVVDDGSTDDTRAVAERYGSALRYVYQPNRGPAAARNLGVSLSTGEILAFLDSDDLWLPDHLSTLLRRLQSVPEPTRSVVMGKVRLTDLQGTSMPVRDDVVTAPQFGSMLIPRPVWDLVGPNDEARHFGQDIDWILRARECGVHFVLMNEVTELYRHHSDNLTRDHAGTHHGVLSAIQMSLLRRRSSGRDLAPMLADEEPPP